MRVLLSVCLGTIALVATLTGQTTPVNPVTTPPSETTVASAKSVNDRYRIGFQDVLDIQVFRHPDLNQRVPVSPEGTIQLFRIDRPIIAVCKTDRELAAEIADAYKEKYLKNPIITVVVADQKSQSVSIMGAVEKPQTFFINRRIHLLELLALAGGPNKEAGTRLIVARTGIASTCREPGAAGDDTVSVIDFKIRDVREGKTIFWMQPGDLVSVLDADIIYVYGNVNRQGAFKVREPITLTQAIVSAEGFKGSVKKDKIRILRTKEGSTEREELVFDLNQIDKRKINDPILQPNDIVAVSEDKAKSILLGFVESLKNTIPNRIYRIP